MLRNFSRTPWLCLWAAALFASSRLVAAQNPTLQGHPDDYPRADIEYGATIYAAECERCHGADGGGVSGVNLRSGNFRNAKTDLQLRTVITNGFPTAGMPAFTKLDTPQLTGVIAYLRNMNTFDRGSVKSGDAHRGQLVFDGKGACLRCHRVEGNGGRIGPDLSDIGANRSPGSLQRSLLDPSSQMFPINRPVHIVTRDGRVINGRRLNEDTYTVQVSDQDGRLLSLNKSDLKEFTILTRSNMPSYKDELTTDEIADVIAYLLSLKGQ
jgi:cytochrome c oxidase cbb3-type subunit 3